MKQAVKRRLKLLFPEAVAAYHFYRSAAQYRRMRSKKSNLGFTFVGTTSMQDGTFEPEETSLIVAALEHIDVFIDVGANTGYFTCVARHHGIKTIAIEPLGNNLDVLYTNLNLNGWNDVEVFPLGLAAQPGITQIYGSGTSASVVKGWSGNSDVLKQTTSLTTLDTILGKRFREQRLFIKIDAEGAEYDILRGAQDTITMNPKPKWLMEICFSENQPAQLNPNFLSTFDLFWENGYEAISVSQERRVVTSADTRRWVANGARDFGYVSYLFQERP